MSTNNEPVVVVVVVAYSADLLMWRSFAWPDYSVNLLDNAFIIGPLRPPLRQFLFDGRRSLAL